MEWWDGIACAAAVISLAGSFATGWHLAMRRARRVLTRRLEAHRQLEREAVEMDCEYEIEADFLRFRRCGELSPESGIPCHLAQGHEGAHEAQRGDRLLSSWAHG